MEDDALRELMQNQLVSPKSIIKGIKRDVDQGILNWAWFVL